MALCCAAVRRTRRPRALVWFYTLTLADTVSAGSLSCTALTANTICHPSPCHETRPLLENCELFASTSLWSSVYLFVYNSVFPFIHYLRHGEDLIVTPFAQVRADYKSVNLPLSTSSSTWCAKWHQLSSGLSCEVHQWTSSLSHD